MVGARCSVHVRPCSAGTETCEISESWRPSPGPAWRSSCCTWDRSWRSLRDRLRTVAEKIHRSQLRLRHGRYLVSETRRSCWSWTGGRRLESFLTWILGTVSSDEQFVGRMDSRQMVLEIQETSETRELRSLKQNKLSS